MGNFGDWGEKFWFPAMLLCVCLVGGGVPSRLPGHMATIHPEGLGVLWDSS